MLKAKNAFLRSIGAAAVVGMLGSTSVQADPSFGAGLVYVFGKGFGVSVRVFSDDEEGSAVASAGFDYMVQDQSLRGAVGVAYLDDCYFLGADVGMTFGEPGISFGLGLGLADTEPATSSSPATPPPTGGA